MVDYAIVSKGRRIRGFTAASISNSMEAIAGSFSFTFVDQSLLDLKLDIPFGDEVIEVEVDGRRRLRAYLERIQPRIGPQDSSVTIAGREVTCDLVDCHIEKLKSYNGPLGRVIKEIVAPYREVSVEDLGSAAQKQVSTTVEPGQTIWSVIERLSRKAGALLWTAGDGVVMIGKPEPKRSGLVLDRRTITEAEALFNSSEIFSRYVVKGTTQSSDSLGWGANAAQTAVHESAFIKRPRTWCAKGESEHKPADSKTRAVWESNTRLARGVRASLTLQGLDQKARDMLACNSMVSVDYPPIGLVRDMLVSALEFSIDPEENEIVHLELVDEKAYQPEPLRDAELKAGIKRGLGWQ